MAKPSGKKPAAAPGSGKGPGTSKGPAGTPPAAPATGAGKGKTVKFKGTAKISPGSTGKSSAAPARCAKPTCGRFALKGKKHCKEHAGRNWLRALLLALLALLLALLLSQCGEITRWLTPPAKPTPTPAPATIFPSAAPGGKKKPPVVTCPTVLRVVVFFDRNVNGKPDAGEQPLSGFEYRVIETGTEGVTRAGSADALEATPGRKYTVNIVGRVGAWVLQSQSEEVTVPACSDKTVYFGAMAQQIPSLTAEPTAAPTATARPAAEPTPSPKAEPTPVKTPSPTQDYGCNCKTPSVPVPTPSPRPSGVPSPTPIFK